MTPNRNSSLLFKAPTFVPYNLVSLVNVVVVKTVVMVAVNVEMMTRPTSIQKTPNRRAEKDLGALSPYLFGKTIGKFDINLADGRTEKPLGYRP